MAVRVRANIATNSSVLSSLFSTGPSPPRSRRKIAFRVSAFPRFPVSPFPRFECVGETGLKFGPEQCDEGGMVDSSRDPITVFGFVPFEDGK